MRTKLRSSPRRSSAVAAKEKIAAVSHTEWLPNRDVQKSAPKGTSPRARARTTRARTKSQPPPDEMSVEDSEPIVDDGMLSIEEKVTKRPPKKFSYRLKEEKLASASRSAAADLPVAEMTTCMPQAHTSMPQENKLMPLATYNYPTLPPTTTAPQFPLLPPAASNHSSAQLEILWHMRELFFRQTLQGEINSNFNSLFYRFYNK